MKNLQVRGCKEITLHSTSLSFRLQDTPRVTYNEYAPLEDKTIVDAEYHVISLQLLSLLTHMLFLFNKIFVL